MDNQELYEFHPIPDFPWYLINKMGQVWCKKHKYVRKVGNQNRNVQDVLKIAEEGLVKLSMGSGYNYANLLGLGRFKVADLMAHTFLPPDFTRRIVNHKNRIKNDDKLENLERATMGENSFHKWENLSEEEKNKHRISTSIGLKGKKKTLEHRKALSLAKTGKKSKPFTSEHCAAISAGLKGKKFSIERCENISKGRKGKKFGKRGPYKKKVLF